MRLLVTGGSGFLGRRFVARALAEGHQVTGLARTSRAGNTIAGMGALVIRGDLDAPATVASAFLASGCRALVTMSSLGSGHARTIVDAARQSGIERAVFVSTTGVFTTLDPPTKQIRIAAEDTIRTSGLDWTIIRPTMIYGGPDDRNMCRLLALLRRTPVLPVPGGGCHLHQPVHVDDLADLLLRAVGSDAALGRAFDVAGPEPLPFREIVREAASALGRHVTCIPLPTAPAVTLTAVCERLTSHPWLKAEQITRLTEDKAFPIEDARQSLGYAPRSFADGIAAETALLWGPVSPPSRSSEQGRPPIPPQPSVAGRIGVLAHDLRRTAEITDTGTAARFALAVARNAPSIVRSGTLTKADEAMAGRDLVCRPLDNVQIRLPGDAFGAAREMYLRRVYFAEPGYAPATGEVVVDLGANQGLFSVLAASAGADVIAVEALAGYATAFHEHAAANGVAHRIQLLNALVGASSGVLSGAGDDGGGFRAPWLAGIPVLSMSQVLEQGGVDHVDLVKMDIEGSEFALFEESDWLDAVDRIVMEVHPGFGAPASLLAVLAGNGFEAALLDNSLRRTDDLAGAPSGYLYARRLRVPSPRRRTTAAPADADRAGANRIDAGPANAGRVPA
ncbi:FkbM family methyltransferase [Parafrankia sp. BMG5.11]|uniref:FkbM family methyltransferase n=1 Tax=Parafrankia sp. BMG5.11 TaxID=222540 RepID=UPI00103F8E99|nr:FkbM family methyltransferase [Parafrankia sp. BMG5.11]TCJ38752.1 FkbM family methyltransferase [Parafrankia sp. BMG5.11]